MEKFTVKSDSSIDNEWKKGNFHYKLTIAGNGIGISAEISLQTADSLGLQLVNILVEQIDGCIGLKTDHGTKFIIWFGSVEI